MPEKKEALKKYPDFSHKLMSDPVKNGWITGIIAWVVALLIIILIRVPADILLLSVIVPVVVYQTEKKNLKNYKNPPSVENLYKFYLHCGFAMGTMTLVWILFIAAVVIGVYAG